MSSTPLIKCSQHKDRFLRLFARKSLHCASNPTEQTFYCTTQNGVRARLITDDCSLDERTANGVFVEDCVAAKVNTGRRTYDAQSNAETLQPRALFLERMQRHQNTRCHACGLNQVTHARGRCERYAGEIILTTGTTSSTAADAVAGSAARVQLVGLPVGLRLIQKDCAAANYMHDHLCSS